MATVPTKSDARILIVRLGSLGDIVHALPAVHALRVAQPDARLDWVVHDNWLPLLEGCPDVSELIPLNKDSWGAWARVVRKLRSARYDIAIDFQGLYKSALLARLSGASVRIGFAASHAREPGAARFYTHRIVPQDVHIYEPVAALSTAGSLPQYSHRFAPEPKHVIQLNLALAAGAAGGASVSEEDALQFSLRVDQAAVASIAQQLAARGITDATPYIVVSPGGGWGSKCWPAERYGHLLRRLLARAEFAGWRGVVNVGPGERKLGEAVRLVAGEPEAIVLSLGLSELKALLAPRAAGGSGVRCMIAGDTGPLHLAAALGSPVVALFGPTDPARNGPWRAEDIVVRNATPEETTYKRYDDAAHSMLSITVEQVEAAVLRRLGIRA